MAYESSINYYSTGSALAFKNRIINGAMMIDQRNVGAVYTSPSSNSYQLDRWLCNGGGGGFNVQQNAGSVTPPAGFKNYYGVTSTSTTAASNYSIRQHIEGFNSADLMYGTSSAKTTTLSFWVYSSLTGTFGGAIQNSAGNRSYVYSYTINAANTWQYVTATIPGDTSGTWIGATNGIGLTIFISYSVAAGQTGSAGAWTGNDYRAPTGQVNLLGTNGATFYITGVQLEVGTQATAFDWRPFGTELQLCQRYYWKAETIGTACTATSGTYVQTEFRFPAPMRAQPSCYVDPPTRITQYNIVDLSPVFVSAQFSNITPYRTNHLLQRTGGDAITTNATYAWNSSSSSYITASAEL